MAEEVGDDVEVAVEQVVARLAGPTARASAARRRGERRRRSASGSSASSVGQPVAQRRPHVRLAVGGARRARARSPRRSSGSMISSARRVLPAAGLADDRHDAAVAVADELRRSTRAAPARRRGRRTGRRSARGAIPAAAAPVTSHDCSACSRPRMLRARRTARGAIAVEHSAAVAAPIEHAARRGQRLQARRGVDDVAHRRVVGAGQRADEHLAGVDADPHLDRRRVAGVDALVDEAGQRLLHPQRRPARRARRRPRGRPARRTGRRWRRRAPCRRGRRTPRCRRRARSKHDSTAA